MHSMVMSMYTTHIHLALVESLGCSLVFMGPVASAAAQTAGVFSELAVFFSGTVIISASCARVSATYKTRISSLRVSVRIACASAA